MNESREQYEMYAYVYIYYYTVYSIYTFLLIRAVWTISQMSIDDKMVADVKVDTHVTILLRYGLTERSRGWEQFFSFFNSWDSFPWTRRTPLNEKIKWKKNVPHENFSFSRKEKRTRNILFVPYRIVSFFFLSLYSLSLLLFENASTKSHGLSTKSRVLLSIPSYIPT